MEYQELINLLDSTTNCYLITEKNCVEIKKDKK